MITTVVTTDTLNLLVFIDKTIAIDVVVDDDAAAIVAIIPTNILSNLNYLITTDDSFISLF